MLLLLLTGVNMLIFELTAGRVIHRWDKSPSAPAVGKAVAAVSLVMWVSIICMGRIIGFTTSRETVVLEPAPGVNFDDFLQATPPNGGPTSTTPSSKK